MSKDDFLKFCKANNNDKKTVKICFRGARKHIVKRVEPWNVGFSFGYYLHKNPNIDIVYFYRASLHHFNMERIKCIVEWKETEDGANYWNEDVRQTMKLLTIDEFFDKLKAFEDNNYNYFLNRKNFDAFYNAFMRSLLIDKDLEQHPNIRQLREKALQLKIKFD